MKPLTSTTEDLKPDKMLPTLYKKTSTGADQMWSIGTYRNVIITQFGQVGGKIQETHDIVKTGKNIGRSNETTAIEQAELEARAQWEKKKTAKGYVESLSDAGRGSVTPSSRAASTRCWLTASTSRATKSCTPH